MKKAIIAIILLFIYLPAFAQDDQNQNIDNEEVLIPKINKIGIFGGPVLKIGQINKEVGLFMGGTGGVILNNYFSIGGGGYSLVTSVNTSNIFTPKLEMNMEYGGLILGYINNSNDAVHYTFQALIGGGEVSWSENRSWWIFKGWDDNLEKYSADRFFVFEPSLGIEVRPFKYLEVEFGVSYLFALDVNSKLTLYGENSTSIVKTLNNKDLSGFSGMAKFKFIIHDLKTISDIFQDVIDEVENIHF